MLQLIISMRDKKQLARGRQPEDEAWASVSDDELVVHFKEQLEVLSY